MVSYSNLYLLFKDARSFEYKVCYPIIGEHIDKFFSVVCCGEILEVRRRK